MHTCHRSTIGMEPRATTPSALWTSMISSSSRSSDPSSRTSAFKPRPSGPILVQVQCSADAGVAVTHKALQFSPSLSTQFPTESTHSCVLLLSNIELREFLWGVPEPYEQCKATCSFGNSWALFIFILALRPMPVHSSLATVHLIMLVLVTWVPKPTVGSTASVSSLHDTSVYGQYPAEPLSSTC